MSLQAAEFPRGNPSRLLPELSDQIHNYAKLYTLTQDDALPQHSINRLTPFFENNTEKLRLLEPIDQPETDFQNLDPNVIQFEIVAGVIFTSIVTIAVVTGLVILWLSIGIGWIWYLVAAVAFVVMVGLTTLTFSWPPIAYRHARWLLDDTGLEIRRGVIWQQRISVPLGRVQHADVSQGPLQRPFGLSKLTVHTAGTQNAAVELDGLAHTVAIELRDRLVRQSKATEVT